MKGLECTEMRLIREHSKELRKLKIKYLCSNGEKRFPMKHKIWLMERDLQDEIREFEKRLFINGRTGIAELYECR